MESTVDQRTTLHAGPAPQRRRSHLALGFGTVFAIAVISVLTLAVLRPVQDDTLTLLHAPAHDFTLSLYNGHELHLAALRGKTIVLNFWWAGCPPCQQEAGLLEQVSRTWQGKDVVFIGINTEDNTSTARAFLKSFGVTYPNGSDPGTEAIDYGTTGTPETIFITPTGFQHIHYSRPFQDEATIDRLIKQTRSNK